MTLIFNDSSYSIPEVALTQPLNEIKQHLSTDMVGSGAEISCDGAVYNIDSDKLSMATTDFIRHINTISGDGYTVIIGGVTYSINYEELQDAIIKIETMLHDLAEEKPEDDNINLLSLDNLVLMDVNELLLTAKKEK